MAIRPEDIIVTRENFSGSAQNKLYARIIKMIRRGPFIKLILDAGLSLAVLVARQAADEMELDLGQEVWAVFKTTTVHVFSGNKTCKREHGYGI